MRRCDASLRRAGATKDQQPLHLDDSGVLVGFEVDISARPPPPSLAPARQLGLLRLVLRRGSERHGQGGMGMCRPSVRKVSA